MTAVRPFVRFSDPLTTETAPAGGTKFEDEAGGEPNSIVAARGRAAARKPVPDGGWTRTATTKQTAMAEAIRNDRRFPI
jgi:hypothetical protein